MADQVAVEKLLGAPRFEPYLQSMEGDVAAASELYQWNTALAGAWHSQLCHAEVLVRNSMDRALSEWNVSQGCSSEWSLDGNTAPLLYQMVGKPLGRARKQAHGHSRGRRIGHPRKGVFPTHDDVIAQLTFGNWTYLLGESAQTKKGSAQTLWRDGLHLAFPEARPDDSGRHFVAVRLERLRHLRNRVSHHENLLEVKTDNRLQDLLSVLGAIGADYPTWAMAKSRVRSVAGEDPRRRLEM